MKLIWKLALPQICLIVCFALIGFIVLDTSFAEMRRQYVRTIASNQGRSLAKWIAFSSQRAVDEASLFVKLSFVREAYEIALSGDIDDPYAPQSQQAREFLRRELAPMLDGRSAITGERLQLHFHLPNGRSLVRLWRDKNMIVGGADVDISDDLSLYRKTVMNTNRTGRITTGIESGLSGFTIRGVVPVVAPDGRHLGSVEAVQQLAPVLDTLAYPFALYANDTLLEHAVDLRDQEKYPLYGKFIRIAEMKDPAIGALVTPELLEKGRYGKLYEEYGQGTLVVFPLNNSSGRQAGVVAMALDTQKISVAARVVAAILAFMLTVMVVVANSVLLLNTRIFVSRPLNRVKAMIQDIAEDRADLATQIPANQKDEIGELVWWFNTLTAKFADIMRERQAILDKIHRESEKFKSVAHWYNALLDAVPFPISVQDTDMRWTFINKAMERFIEKKREDIIGLPCCDFTGICVCNTENCAVACAKRGITQTHFTHHGASFQVDTALIKGLLGEPVGFLELIQDITPLERLRTIAESKSQAKSAFLAQMSHEMRTPLNAVLGLSEIMFESGGLNEDNETCLTKIQSAGTILLNIINDILDISKIEAGKLEMVQKEYDVPEMINDAVTQNILRIHSRPIRFTLDVNEDTPMRLYGDELRVKQILNNLLSNAFKYTEKGTVELSLAHERKGDEVWVTLRVRDTGIGIRPEDLNRIFIDYNRFDKSSNRKTDGTGLGLAITKRLVERMGGTVSIESEFGRGSVFTARFRQRHVNDSVIGYDVAELLRNFRYTTSRHGRSSPLNRVSIPYARVLVVDDNLTNLYIARCFMKPYGMAVECVASGQEAIDAIREEKRKYDAIFMDHMMPGMDGIEAVRIIREEIGSEYARTIPIIALTANAVVGTEELFLSKGFNVFLPKPIDIFQLDAVIRKWVWDKEKDALQAASSELADRRKRQDRRKKRDRRIADRRSGVATQPPAKGINGLDWTRGLEIFGDEGAFSQVLRSYTVNTRPLLESISEVHEDSLAQYAITVHGIKSSSYGVCARGLGGLAESLEAAAKAGNLDFVSLHNAELLQMAHKLIEEMEALLDNAVPSDPKPQKNKPDNQVLQRLCAACDSYDLEGIDEAMREIDGFEYLADNGLTAWLRDNVARLNYADIVEKITQL